MDFKLNVSSKLGYFFFIRKIMLFSLGGKIVLLMGVVGYIGKVVVKGLVEVGCYVIGIDCFFRYFVDDLFEEL